MRMKPIILLLAGWMAFSCVYPYEVNLQSPAEQILVVDGNIVLGRDASLSVLSMKSMRDTPGGSYSRANIEDWWVEDDAGTQYKPTSAYGKASMKTAPEGRGYRMVMKIEGKTYSTPFQQPLPAPEIKSLELWADNEQVHVGISLEDKPEAFGYSAISLEEIWEFHAQFKPEYDYNGIGVYELEPDDPAIHYWCWAKTTSPSELLLDYSQYGGGVDQFAIHAFPREDNRNHKNYTIKASVRSISRDEAVYLKNLDNKAVQGNNLFSLNPGEVPGNVFCEDDPSEQVLGYVSLKAYSARTAHIGNQYLLEEEMDDNRWFTNLPYADWYEYYYERNWRPVRFYMPDDAEGPGKVMGWVERRCVDCEFAGGLLKKPEFDD